MVEYHEVHFEAGHVDEDGEDDETCYTCTPMSRLVSLCGRIIISDTGQLTAELDSPMTF